MASISASLSPKGKAAGGRRRMGAAKSDSATGAGPERSYAADSEPDSHELVMSQGGQDAVGPAGRTGANVAAHDDANSPATVDTGESGLSEPFGEPRRHRQRGRAAELAAVAEGAAGRRRGSVSRSRKAKGERRRTVADWIAAGQDILREEGVAGLKLAPLTRRLGVSTGSFYHHFADFEDYLGALADHYSLDRVQGELNLTLAGETDPIGRIKCLGRISLRQGTFDLDRAMRIWATMDPRAERTVRKGEAMVLSFLADCFGALGFPPEEAQLRAYILLSVNVAPLGLPQGQSRRLFFRNTLRLLTGRDDVEIDPDPALPEPAAVAAGPDELPDASSRTARAGREGGVEPAAKRVSKPVSKQALKPAARTAGGKARTKAD